MELPDAVKPVTDALSRAATAAGIFLGFLLVAALVAGGVKLLAWLGMAPDAAVATAPYVEDGLYAADVICLASFVVSEVATYLRGLWNEWRSPNG